MIEEISLEGPDVTLDDVTPQYNEYIEPIAWYKEMWENNNSYNMPLNKGIILAILIMLMLII